METMNEQQPKGWYKLTIMVNSDGTDCYAIDGNFDKKHEGCDVEFDGFNHVRKWLDSYLKSITIKPNKNIEFPPYETPYEGFGGCLFKHKYEWVLTPKKQWRQEVCKKCGTTGKTEKI